MSHADRYAQKPGRQGKASSVFRRNRTAWIASGVVLVIIIALAVVFIQAGRAQSTGPMDKSIGLKDAPVTIVEYGDFQCPACKSFALSMEPRIKAQYVDTGKARLVFRHMAFIGQESVQAAVASECANEQGRFWDYYARLYQGQSGENVGAFSMQNLSSFAQDIGLDTGKFNRCLSTGKYLKKVQDETAEGDVLGVQQTPTVLIDGQIIEWDGNLAKLEEEIKKIVDAKTK